MKKYLNAVGRSSAFTLIEVMVVVVILAILAAIVVPSILKRPDQARHVAAKQAVLNIQDAMNLYKLDNGIYPSQEQGIQALVSKPDSDPAPMDWNGPYLKQLPTDPWGHAYQYKNPGDHGDIDIYTFDDHHKEIGNW